MSDAPEPLNSVLRRNIEILQRRRAEEAQSARFQDRLAERISHFAGSIAFVLIHLALLAGWIVWNLGFTPLTPFDPSFVILATAASVEAIFLSTFILIAQNRAAVAADRRSDLDLQISLLSEHEVTRVLDLCSRIAERLGIEAASPELKELRRDVAPERVLEEIEEAEEKPER